MSNIESILQQKFGLSAFRKGQKEIIQSVLAKKDVLAVLPTGGGKSLCFQLPSISEKKIVLVISPLIALMKDQVAGLAKRNIPAGCLHSDQTEKEKLDVFRRLSTSESFILYISPERAHTDGFRRWVKDKPISLFAIDEAHCVSQWGHDFREEYGKLKMLRELRPDVPILALTASATPLVLQDVAKNLLLEKPDLHVHGFYRPNLYYQVEFCRDEDEKLRFLIQAIEKTPKGRIIVYCGTRKSTEEVGHQLGRVFQGVAYYHAGMNGDKRTKIQEEYAAGKSRILVATNAFGMGIDHPDVRLVVHHHMPANIDALYQEMGRAGRDGEDSTCLLLYSKKDKSLQTYFIQSSTAPTAIKSSRYQNLDALVNYAEGGECRHSEILTYYHDSQRIDKCGHCDSCDPASDRRVEMTRAEIIPATPYKKKSSKAAKKKSDASPLGGLEAERFEALKEWRRKRSKEMDIAAFMIFSDKTLRELARDNPQTKEALGAVYGIGAAKLEAFGDEVLQQLKGFGG